MVQRRNIFYSNHINKRFRKQIFGPPDPDPKKNLDPDSGFLIPKRTIRGKIIMILVLKIYKRSKRRLKVKKKKSSIGSVAVFFLIVPIGNFTYSEPEHWI